MNILIATNNPAKAREIQAVLMEAPPSTSPPPPPTPSPSLHRPASPQWLSLSDLAAPIPEPEETGSSFLQNATLKALHYARMSGMWALADDSGLEVDALGGEPGVHSAYFDRSAAHLPRPQRDAANNAKLVAAIRDVPPDRRTARYHCVMVLAGPKCLPPDTECLPPGTAHPPPGDPAPLPARPPGSIGLRPVRITTQPTNDATNDATVLATAHGLFEGLILDQPRGDGGFGYDPYFLIPELQMTAAELPAHEKNRISHRGKALNAMSEQIRELLNPGR